ncbi:MAG: hypothetical protein ACREUQ_08915, partial [Burkholderiales bacterium]
MTRAMCLILVLAAAAGCVAPLHQPVETYDFGLPPDTPPSAIAIRIPDMKAPDWLDRIDMLYRLAYRDPRSLET